MKIGKNKFILMSGILGVFLITLFYMKLIYVPKIETVQNDFEQTSIDPEQDTTPELIQNSNIQVYDLSSESAKIFASNLKSMSIADLEQECKVLGGKSLIRPYPNGSRKNMGCIKNGQTEGKFVSWFESGELRSIGNFKEGVKDGNYTIWYENGRPKMVFNVVNEILDGKLFGWHENGQKKHEEIYQNGDAISILKWDEYGNQISVD